MKGDDKADIESIILERERVHAANDAFQKQLTMLKDTFDSPSTLSRLGSKAALSSQLLSAALDKNTGNDDDDRLQQRVRLDDLEKRTSQPATTSSYWCSTHNNSDTTAESGTASSVDSADSNSAMFLASNEFAFTEASQRFHNVRAGILASSAYPTRLGLKTKRTIRSRLDLGLGKMSILIQPKAFPLEGDSSLIVSKGKWWVKDGSAIHTVPMIHILSLPTMDQLSADSNTATIPKITIRLSNPKETSTVIRIMSNIAVAAAADDDDDDEAAKAREPFACSVTNMISLPCSPSDAYVYTLTLAGHEDELLRENNDSSNNDTNSSSFSGDSDHWNHKTVDHTAIITIPFQKVNIQSSSSSSSSSNGHDGIFQYKLSISFKDEDSNDTNNVNVLIAFTL